MSEPIMWILLAGGCVVCYFTGWLVCHWQYQRIIRIACKSNLDLTEDEREELRIALERWHEQQGTKHGTRQSSKPRG